MLVEFEDGSTLTTKDWAKMLSLIKQRAKDGEAKPVKIKQNGVTLNVKGYDPVVDKADKAVAVAGNHSNFIESKHKGWKIRVWREDSETYGCNYLKGDDVRYLQVPVCDVRDENGVFKYASSIIDDI